MRGGFRIGAGRKAGLNKVNYTLTLTKEEAQTLKERAKAEELTPSRFVAKHLQLTPPQKTNSLPESLTGNIRLTDGMI